MNPYNESVIKSLFLALIIMSLPSFFNFPYFYASIFLFGMGIGVMWWQFWLPKLMDYDTQVMHKKEDVKDVDIQL